MKIKIFAGYDSEIEQLVNNWLSDTNNKVRSIIDFTTCPRGGNNLGLCIVVRYNEVV